MNTIRLKVFISSVQKELREERAALGGLLATDPFLAGTTVPRLFEEYAILSLSQPTLSKRLKRAQVGADPNFPSRNVRPFVKTRDLSRFRCSTVALATRSSFIRSTTPIPPSIRRERTTEPVTYFDKTLSDPSVFDFYHKLIDGDNKREWQRWNAFDVSVVQSLFNDRLVIQAVADHQDYRYGQEGGA